jgi:hypothetical protein
MGKGEAGEAESERSLFDDWWREPISAANNEGDTLDASVHSTLEPSSELGACRLFAGGIEDPRLESFRKGFLYFLEGFGVASLRYFSDVNVEISPNASQIVVNEGAKVGLLDLARRYDPEAHLPL